MMDFVVLRNVRVFGLAVAVAALFGPRPAVAAALTSTAQMNALIKDRFKAGEPFVLTGMVSTVLYNSHFILEDETGRTHIRLMNSTNPPHEGDRVILQGRTSVDAFHQIQACATNLVVELPGNQAPEFVPESADRILGGDCDYANVRLTGLVADCFPDDVNDFWSYLILKVGDDYLLVTVPNEGMGEGLPLDRYARAIVTVSGTVLNGHCGPRRFIGPHLETAGFGAVQVVHEADDIELELSNRLAMLSPHELTQSGLHSFEGRVMATWGRGSMLVVDVGSDVHRVDLSPGEKLPPSGAWVAVRGQPETDLYRLNLSRASWEERPAPESGDPVSEPNDQALLQGPGELHYMFHGRIVRVRGRILAEAVARSNWRAVMETENHERLLVDLSGIPEESERLTSGMVVELTGCGLIETENWKAGVSFPRQKDIVLVVRTADDIRVLSRPSWWTSTRLWILVAVLFGLLVVFLVWIRVLNRLVNRKGRELYHEAIAHASAEFRTAERTRLATDMHDSLSQALTGISCQIDAMEAARVKRPDRLEHHLTLARTMLKACRVQLRNCLWDLRNDVLNDHDAARAIRKTLAPHLGETTATYDFQLPREAFSDSTFHEVLCIIRELVANAIRHGKARHVAISGSRHNGGFLITVADDGCGFDPENRPGSGEGHYGLLGVSERLERMNGTFEIISSPGRGATCRIVIPKKA